LIGGFTMTATQVHSSHGGPEVLYVAFELGWSEWKLASSSAPADNPRLKILRARNLAGLGVELAKAKKHFRLPADAAVSSCYEAGRDGFWLHRYLTSVGVHNLVVDSSSIEVQRRGRRAKNDSLDASKLLSMLWRYHGQEKNVWKVVHIPSMEDEDRRQLHRDLLAMKAQRTQGNGGNGDIPRLFGMKFAPVCWSWFILSKWQERSHGQRGSELRRTRFDRFQVFRPPRSFARSSA